MKAPFPWFGGKSLVAPEVWVALGDVYHYIEPFLGSGAVFLARPHPHKIATLNEKDPLVVNFYRAIKYAPEETAKWAAWPVTESDKHAREVWILSRLTDLRAYIEGDPEYYDAKLAGYWVYGISMHAWGGWCDGRGSWVVDDERKLVKREEIFDSNRQGIVRRRPNLVGPGHGVNRLSFRAKDRPLFDLENDGVIFNQAKTKTLIRYFNALAEKFSIARIICGDWTRVVEPVVVYHNVPCGIFFDPPYSQDLRSDNLYSEDVAGISEAVREWCLENGNNPKLRIVLAGYEGEGHEVLEEKGWRVFAWKTQGGYGNLGDGSNDNKFKERLWFSPYCLGFQGDLFAQHQNDK